jgi:hypothetical protein
VKSYHFKSETSNPNLSSFSFSQSNTSPTGLLQRRHSLTSISEKIAQGISTVDDVKKESVSAWGKVMNMIYTRRDSLKKKSWHKSSSIDHRSPESISSPTRENYNHGMKSNPTLNYITEQ